MSALTIPDAIHLCPRCNGLASGPSLCEECQALGRLARQLDHELRFAWILRPWRMLLSILAIPAHGFQGSTRDLAALLFCFFGVCGYLAILFAGAVRLIEVLR